MKSQNRRKHRTRTTKVEHKAPDMSGQENMRSRIYVDRPTYRQTEMSKYEIKGLLNLADIFCLQIYVKIPLFKPF